MEKVIRLKKHAARVITGDFYFQQRSSNLFNTLKWQTMDERIQEKRLTILYKCLNGLAPNYLRELFQFISDTHTHGLRSSTSNSLFVKGGKIEYHKRRFSYLAARDWNEILTPECRDAESLTSFKRLFHDII